MAVSPNFARATRLRVEGKVEVGAQRQNYAAEERSIFKWWPAVEWQLDGGRCVCLTAMFACRLELIIWPSARSALFAGKTRTKLVTQHRRCCSDEPAAGLADPN